MQQVAEHILDLTRQRGFAWAGIAAAEPSEHAAAVRQWVADGKHGTMEWFAAHLEVRIDLDKLLPGAASVIAVADVYAAEPPKGLRGKGVTGSSERQENSIDDSHSAPLPLCPSAPDSPAAPRGKIARYAWGDDYHKVMKKRLHRLSDALAELFPQEKFRTTVDTAPALERELAARAGLGWQAKNTMLIHPRHGSYTLLGLIVTTLRVEGLRGNGVEGQSEQKGLRGKGVEGQSGQKGLRGKGVEGQSGQKGLRGKGVEGQSEEPGNKSVFPHSAPLPLSPSAPAAPGASGGCANCTRCIDACPTGAIAAEGYSIDASRCVSYLTLEHRDVVAPEFHEGFRGWIAGCDICQEVCPYNIVGQRPRNVLAVLPEYDPAPRKFDEGLDLLEVLSWTAEDRARVFRGSALKRMKLDMVRRNALIAIGNVLARRDDAALREAVRGCLHDDSALMRDTARQVWKRINDSVV